MEAFSFLILPFLACLLLIAIHAYFGTTPYWLGERREAIGDRKKCAAYRPSLVASPVILTGVLDRISSTP